MKKLDVIAAVLLVVGGLNWGVVATDRVGPCGRAVGQPEPGEPGGLPPGRTRRPVSGGAVEGHSAPLAARPRR